MLPVLAGILPPALDLDSIEAALDRVMAVDVGDLELSTARRLERRDNAEDVRGIAVETDDRVRGGRLRVARVDDSGLLNDVGHAFVPPVHDDAEVLGIGDLLDEDLRTASVLRPLD